VVLCGGGPYPLKGSVPAEILMIGESPGDSEDMLGLPFQGPAGYLLARIMREAGVLEHRYCLTNLVACFPKGEVGGKLGQPPKEAILACRPRLVEFVKIVKPRLVVFVGKLAEQWSPFDSDFDGSEWVPKYLWADPLKPLRFASILHPAAILRAETMNKEFLVKRCVVALQDAVASLGG
jgi:DNA polymerase